MCNCIDAQIINWFPLQNVSRFFLTLNIMKDQWIIYILNFLGIFFNFQFKNAH